MPCGTLRTSGFSRAPAFGARPRFDSVECLFRRARIASRDRRYRYPAEKRAKAETPTSARLSGLLSIAVLCRPDGPADRPQTTAGRDTGGPITSVTRFARRAPGVGVHTSQVASRGKSHEVFNQFNLCASRVLYRSYRYGATVRTPSIHAASHDCAPAQ